jgi:protein-S-isoprenylcysteine O-methyltransferase Ste14
MPRLALVLCLVWFSSLFLFRSFVQWKRTGATGFKGFHGRVGSLEWFAGMAATAGLVLAPLAPLASVNGWRGGELWFTNAAAHVAGALLAGVGILGALAAQLSMGSSWRIGVDESERTTLVTDGLFAWVRNPIFSFIWISLLGFWLLIPSPLALLAFLLTFVGIELQVRAVEEPYLLQAHGESYARYAAAVGRFAPGLGRLADDESRGA